MTATENGGAAAGGLVVASHQAAADAGASALTAGGSAVDAAVATAFALAVVDPASCGVGGYGGFLLYAPPGGPPVQVDFNTWVPTRLGASVLRIPGETAPPLDGGAAVAPLAVVPGLLHAHGRFGRRPLEELLAPSIRLARDGFAVDPVLARAFSDHSERTGGGQAEFASIFFPAGRPPATGDRVVQPDLALTLESIADRGADAFRTGALVDAVCTTVAADGGFLRPEDFLADEVAVSPAATRAFASATVYAPSPETSGAGILFSALGHVDPGRLGANRAPEYVAELARALALAWTERSRAATAALASQHTTHLCTADAEGGIASLTFTHGVRRFGSGLVASGTGVVLNSGANLFAPTAAGPLAVTNMTPVIVEEANGDRHALGSVGGPRIPAIVLSSVVDLVRYRLSLAESIAAPHLSVRAADGELEAEPELARSVGAEERALPLVAGVSFGPTCGLSRTSGGVFPGADPRFGCGVARS